MLQRELLVASVRRQVWPTMMSQDEACCSGEQSSSGAGRAPVPQSSTLRSRKLAADALETSITGKLVAKFVRQLAYTFSFVSPQGCQIRQALRADSAKPCSHAY